MKQCKLFVLWIAILAILFGCKSATYNLFGKTDDMYTASNGIEAGDFLEFGGHKWIVLDVQDGYALILSKEIISRKPFAASNEPVTWETSDIRHWLNNIFLTHLGI